MAYWFSTLNDFVVDLFVLTFRERDEELDAIVISAQALVSRLKQLNCLTKDVGWVNESHVVSLLALFVSDHFGGSDKSAIIERTRKAVSGSNYQKPFVCTCSTGNINSVNTQTKPTAEYVEDIVFSDICDKSLRVIKARRNSIIVPLGTLHFGVCRHRALLMKVILLLHLCYESVCVDPSVLVLCLMNL